MNISIEIDEPKTDETNERKEKFERLLDDLNSHATKCEGVSRHRHGSFLLVSEEALLFLAIAINTIEHRKFSYKFRVCDVEDAGVWERKF